ncbi:MAG TPA: hypothetical protein VFN29_06075 [Chiayiivirga sp.]|nr:hypothetical protein [Chiayiivirga sp.]
MYKLTFKNLAVGALALTLAPVLHAAEPTSTHSGNWWDPADEGWGVATLDQGNILGPYWFSYDEEGRPTWLMGVGMPQADGSFAGDLYRFNGHPLQQIDGPASTASQIVGTVKVSFPADPHTMQFSTTINGETVTRQMTRYDFGGKDVVCKGVAKATPSMTNYTDMWWEPSTTGWGINVIHLDDRIYGQWYTYEAPDKAVFLTLSLERQADGSYRGPVHRQNNGGRPFNSKAKTGSQPGAVEIGTASLIFLDGVRAEFDYVVGADEGHHVLQRFQFGNVANQCEVQPYNTNGGGGNTDGEECYPEYALNDTRTLRSNHSTNGVQGAPVDLTETVVGTATFNGHAGFRQTSTSSANGGAYANSYVGNGQGTIMSFGAEAIDTSGQVISTSKNDPTKVELSRFFKQGETVRVDFGVDSTSAAGQTREEILSTYRLVGKESVTTPAGSFTACKLEYTLELRSDIAGMQLLTQTSGFIWADPVFGMVKQHLVGTSKVTAYGTTTTTDHVDDQELLSASMAGGQRP